MKGRKHCSKRRILCLLGPYPLAVRPGVAAAIEVCTSSGAGRLPLTGTCPRCAGRSLSSLEYVGTPLQDALQLQPAGTILKYTSRHETGSEMAKAAPCRLPRVAQVSRDFLI